MLKALAWCLGSEFILIYDFLNDDEKFYLLLKLLKNRTITFPKDSFLKDLCKKIYLVELYLSGKIIKEEVLKKVENLYFDIICEILKNNKHRCIPDEDDICVICGKKVEIPHQHKIVNDVCVICKKRVLNE